MHSHGGSIFIGSPTLKIKMSREVEEKGIDRNQEIPNTK